VIRDLVCDVSWNYEVNKRIPPFQPKPEADGTWRMQQEDIDRVQEFRKCIECFLCQDVCHVLRDHERRTPFAARASSSDREPRDAPARHASRTAVPAGAGGHRLLQHHEVLHRGLPRVDPHHDNAIIPLKERVVDEFYDPLRRVWRWLTGGRNGAR
jgi:succinate dehydrogenase / fumarate reductase iron-sulfur subunit